MIVELGEDELMMPTYHESGRIKTRHDTGEQPHLSLKKAPKGVLAELLFYRPNNCEFSVIERTGRQTRRCI